MTTEATFPTNLAQLKRFLKPGAQLRAVWRFYSGDVNELRSVFRAQSDGVYFEAMADQKQNPFFAFKKAGDYDFTDRGFTAFHADSLGRAAVVRYEWVKAGRDE